MKRLFILLIFTFSFGAFAGNSISSTFSGNNCVIEKNIHNPFSTWDSGNFESYLGLKVNNGGRIGFNCPFSFLTNNGKKMAASIYFKVKSKTTLKCKLISRLPYGDLVDVTGWIKKTGMSENFYINFPTITITSASSVAISCKMDEGEARIYSYLQRDLY